MTEDRRLIINNMQKIAALEKRCDTFNKLDTESAIIEQSLQRQIKELSQWFKLHDNGSMSHKAFEKEILSIVEGNEKLEQKISKLKEFIKNFRIATSEKYGKIEALSQNIDGIRKHTTSLEQKLDRNSKQLSFLQRKCFPYKIDRLEGVLRDLIRKMPNKYWELYEKLGKEKDGEHETWQEWGKRMKEKEPLPMTSSGMIFVDLHERVVADVKRKLIEEFLKVLHKYPLLHTKDIEEWEGRLKE